MTRKNKLQAHIREYQRRREKLRERFPNWRRNPGYKEAVKTINYRILLWKRQIRRIERREPSVWRANRLVSDFAGFKTLFKTTTSSKNKPLLHQARAIFVKYGMEALGVPGAQLADFLNCHPVYAAEIRRKFTRSLATNEANRLVWERFKLYLKSKNIPLYGDKAKLAA